MKPQVGHVFGGRYELKNRLAIGGMGEVWHAVDTVIERKVAIKILKEEYLGEQAFRERFRAEARHAALVNHEGIAGVYDFGEEEGSAYLVMELVPGEALSVILERERILSPERVLDIVAQTASALHAAHEAGLVHRDIKPGNLLITPDGRVKITDFGIARAVDQVPLTATGQVMGTVQYLSPEQASGKTASPLTDIYSLGIVAYEALAGRRPFTGESQVAIAMAHIKNPPPPLPESIPLAVRNLILSCIAKKPELRPASAQHLARAAVAISRGRFGEALALVPAVDSEDIPDDDNEDTTTRILPVSIPAEDMPKPARQPRKKLPWQIIALASVLALVIVGTLIGLIGRFAGQPSPSDTPSSSASASPSASASSNGRVTVTETDFIGLTENQVRDLLERQGLRLDAVTGEIPDSADLVGTAYRVNPTGSLPINTLVAVYFYDAIPTPAAPGALTVSNGPYTAGSTITVSWPTYAQCPAGFPLKNYIVTANGGTVANAGILSATATTTSIVIDNNTSEVRVSYIVKCGTLSSNPSEELVVPVG
ncbi:MAG: serine/threonine kinase [Actinomycetota bacterium]|jgi:serine/threonine-protein kinase